MGRKAKEQGQEAGRWVALMAAALAGVALGLAGGWTPVSAQGVGPTGVAHLPDTPAVVAFEGVSVLPMDPELADPVVPGQTVVVRDGRIEAMGAAGEVDVPAEALRIDGTGRFLIPGLAEMHAHVPPSADPPREDVEEILFLFVANGVTTMRGMLGAPWQLDLRDELARGEVLGPRFYVGAPSLNGNTAPDPESAEERVRAHADAGYDLLKIHPGVPRASWDRMVEVAREVGITWAGHVPGDVGIEHALRTGISTVDHLDGFLEASRRDDLPQGAGRAETFRGTDEDALEALVELAVGSGAWMVPTQYLWDNLMGRVDDPEGLLEEEEFRYVSPSQREAWLRTARQRPAQAGVDEEAHEAHARWRHELLGRLHQAGVPILMGTDSPQLMNVPGFALHRELPLMEEAGMTPLEVLQSGTVNVARYVEEHLGQEAPFGRIAPGLEADLVLLEGNPLDDLGHLRSPAGVMVRGAWLPEEEIRTRLEAIARRHAGEG
ncbi:MAG: amidohydrolase [Gemmatimonadales bacterium]|nr:MAG: amidohydrolase [Gemmatimonadales bacterium]